MKKQYILPTTEHVEMLGGSCMYDASGVMNNTPVNGDDNAPVFGEAPTRHMPRLL